MPRYLGRREAKPLLLARPIVCNHWGMSSTPSPDRAVQLEFFPFPDVGELNDAICRSGVPEATAGMPRLHPMHMQVWPPRVKTLADVAIAELAAGMEILILGGTAIAGVVLALTAKLPRVRDAMLARIGRHILVASSAG